MTEDIRARLKEAEGSGRIADVTGRLGGQSFELDPPGWKEGGRVLGRRQAGEGKMSLLPVSRVKDCLEKIQPGDRFLFFAHSGRLVYEGVAVAGPDGALRFRHADSRLSNCTLAQYCSHWRTLAGIKVLRGIWDSAPYNYTKREVMMPMRDGIRLYAAVYEPVTRRKRPVLLLRSPYPAGHYGGGGVGDLSERTRVFREQGYIIVEQNVRGTYMSEGEFVNVRPLLERGAAGCDEASDAFDTIEWLLANTRNNGRVGVYGVSYPGFYATLAALCGHPALKAVSPQAPVTDWWMGDDTHHNGAFMLSDIYSFGASFFLPKLNPTPDSRDAETAVPEGMDLYEFFKGRPLGSLLRDFAGRDSFFHDIKTHPDYDAFWRRRNPLRHLKGVKPAVMVVGGLYDAEDAWGAAYTYRALREQSPETESYYVCGPWSHGGWKKLAGYLEDIEYPFFAYYLEGKGHKPPFRELYYPSGLQPADSEAPEGRMADPCGFAEHRFELRPGAFISDPADPVPYMDVKSSRREKSYMWADQGFASRRRDVYQDTLYRAKSDVLLFGQVQVHLNASSSGTDADFVVKLLDRAPDGSSALVRADVMPARWRNSTVKGEALVPGKGVPVCFSMNAICHVLKAGHVLAVQVQGSWFPLIPMNPQIFVKNPYTNVSTACRKATMRILKGSWISFGIKC